MATSVVVPAKVQSAPGLQRHNELTLAGLRPGSSRASSATRMPELGTPSANATGFVWSSRCIDRILSVETDDNRTVQAVTASMLGSSSAADCAGQADGKMLANLRTGRGLELGNACQRAEALYGNPESRGPSVRGMRKLELLFYSFDWAGEDVPQSMEVSCDAVSHRVVEITLAFQSL